MNDLDLRQSPRLKRKLRRAKWTLVALVILIELAIITIWLASNSNDIRP